MRSLITRLFILLGLFFPALAFISATAGAATIASYAGTYSGTFSGADSGTWTTTISSIGSITATGNSSTSGAFTASGQASSTGSLSMTAGSVSTGATFNGAIDSVTGAISGTWTDNGSGLGGTWSGSKAATSSVSKTSQTVSFGTAPMVVVGSTGTTSATATSGLTVSFSSMTPSVCSVSNSTVTGITAGACIIAANQSGDANYNAAMQVTQSITIGVATAPAVSFSPTSLTFAAQNTGTSSSAQTTTLSNTGSAVLNISSIAASGDYARTTTCGATLAAGASCTISVTFTPTAAGTRTGAVTVTSNAATSPSIISLSGTESGGASTPNTPVALNLITGWNLLGNSSAAPIDVTTTFGDASKITTVWKWNKIASKWAFYAPSMTSTALSTYAQNKGYDVLTSIAPKEGFWVNASAVAALSGPTASGMTLVESDLQQGWNLVGSADNKTPSQLYTGLSYYLSFYGKAIITAWAWDAPNKNWMFYAPSLEASGGLANYITAKGYLPFSTPLSATDGFWLNIGVAPIINTASFTRTYNLTTNDGTAATIIFDSTGNVSSCKLNSVIACSGKLALNSVTGTVSFQISGNDGLSPVDTTASLNGTIAANGSVSGNYSGASVSAGTFSGTFTGGSSQYEKVTVAGLNSHGQMETLVLQNNVGETLNISSNGTYTFASPLTGAARIQTITQQPAGQVCAATKSRVDTFDPYTGQLITENTATYYCFESPCGDIESLGQAPAPKGLTATINPDSTMTVSWQNDPWANWYHVYYGTDPSVVTSSPMTGFAQYQNFTIGLFNSTSTGTLISNTPYYVAISSIYNSPANLAGCQSSASTAVIAVPTPAAPTISGISPTSGAVGTVVTITGTNFSATPANNTVMFNGIPATVTSSTSTILTVTVPGGATTGAVTVTTAGGTTSWPTSNFVVTTPTTGDGALTFSSAPLGYFGDSSTYWNLSVSDVSQLLSPVIKTSYYFEGGKILTTSSTAKHWRKGWRGTDSSHSLVLNYYTDPAPISFYVDSTKPAQAVEYLNIEMFASGATSYIISQGYTFPLRGTVCFVAGSIPASTTTSCSSLGITFNRAEGRITFNNTQAYFEDINSGPAPSPSSMSGSFNFTPF